MHYLTPKLFTVISNYNKDLLIKDILAGAIVGIIAIPLSIALAIASGLSPEAGLYTAVVGGFFISFFGGSRVQIGGPTAAFIPLIYMIVKEHGTNGLIISTLIASIFLILMGIFRMGKMIKYIPYPVVTGFTTGIAICILISQLKDFFGFTFSQLSPNSLDLFLSYIKNISNINPFNTAIGLASILIIIFWRKTPLNITQFIPGSLIAILVSIFFVHFFNLTSVTTIGQRYSDIVFKFPSFSLPSDFSFTISKQLISYGFAIAILAGIESLLSAVVADGMIGGHHRSDAELLAQGIANASSVLFGGIPATGAIARTAANIKSGAKTPISGIVHSLTILIVMLLLTPYLKLIPLSTLASILIIVSYDIGDWKSFKTLFKAPKSDAIVFILTFVLTVVFDIVIAIEVGMVLAAFLFMRRMIEVSEVTLIDNENNTDNLNEENIREDIFKQFGRTVILYEIKGPFFFGASEKIFNTTSNMMNKPKVIILKMKDVPAIDLTGIHSLERLHLLCKKHGVKLFLTNLHSQTHKAIEKYGFIKTIGENNIFNDIKAAINNI